MSYDRRQVEALIPAIWDDAYLIHGLAKEEVRDPEMPGSKADPRTAGGHIVAIADIRKAWRWTELTHRERQSLVLTRGMDMPRAEAARHLGVSRQAVEQAAERGVGRLVAWLNGKDYEDLEAA